MLSLLIVLLSALVLALAGTVVVLALRLRTLKKGGEAAAPHSAQPEDTEAAVLQKTREKAAKLGMDIKRSLTHIHTTTPSTIPGLSIERILLLCADELKERINTISGTFQNGFPDRLAQGMDERDLAQLDDLLGRMASIAEEVKHLDEILTPVFKAWSNDSTVSFDPYEQRLTDISRRLKELHQQVQDLLRAISEKQEMRETPLTVPERIGKAAALVTDPGVCSALIGLETQARQHYDSLDRQTKTRVESYYLQTLELVLGELGRAERAGENTDTRKQLSIRVIRVLSNILTTGQQAQSEISERSLEAEVAALERLATLRGDDSRGDLGLPC
ncbi:MAG: hypothetical protein ACI4O3_01790 [Oscillospiraceae bacterium]